MRYGRLSLLLLLPAAALSACEPDLKPGPIVDLVGSARLTTNNRRLTGPADTVAVRAYARTQGDEEPNLERLRIRVEYRPTAEPLTYALPYDPDNPPLGYLTYVDSAISGRDFAFQSVQPGRTTAGLETWRYEFSDAEGRTGQRSLRLRLVRTDSALVYHSYTVSLQAPGPVTRRSFLALRQGLALPRFTVLAGSPTPEAQQLIDLVYVPGTGAPGLATPADAALNLKASRWPQKRLTELRSTTLTTLDNAATTEALDNAFNAGQSFATATRTGPLRQNQVLAFRTPEGKTGLIRVESISTTGIPTLVLQVRVTK
ncbi:hypothetical protein [Hymenobacter weizhouensis]|uniref:hypothetical protein n=1 Tax=Hymenobacter sp. YIM 151500-1 TaxID=2987689 RepID=UPI00222801AE|nr:hypothetical protein [Hymenobacter sp. YIM 151500-1]UYZ62112.1 hypothetical protein OIS53_13985 [Hymenobacter sp. YIM 151500-1]